MDIMHLQGAEDVLRASHGMRSAADTMSSAATNLDGVLERHQRFMDFWLQRFEEAIAKMQIHPVDIPTEIGAPLIVSEARVLADDILGTLR